MKKLVFLGFEDSLPGRAAKRLVDETENNSRPDLGNVLMILPGSFAVREVMRELAERVPCGMFPPSLMTQGKFLEEGRNLSNAATEYESNLIRARVLFSCDHSKYPSLFTGKNAPGITECFYLSRMLGNFIKELSLGGITLEDAIRKNPANKKRFHPLLRLK